MNSVVLDHSAFWGLLPLWIFPSQFFHCLPSSFFVLNIDMTQLYLWAIFPLGSSKPYLLQMVPKSTSLVSFLPRYANLYFQMSNSSSPPQTLPPSYCHRQLSNWKLQLLSNISTLFIFYILNCHTVKNGLVPFSRHLLVFLSQSIPSHCFNSTSWIVP